MDATSGKRALSVWAIGAVALGVTAYAVKAFADASSAPTLESAVYFGGAGDQRGTSLSIQGGNIYLSGIEGQGSELEALALKFASPPGPSPLWSARWPNPTGTPAPVDDYFQGVATTAEGVYFPGGSYSQTTDGVGGKESKSILAKFPLTGATAPAWVAKPHFYPYTGVESLYAATTAVESGSPVVYAVGGGQPCSYGAYIMAKFDAAGSMLGRVTDPGQEAALSSCSYNGVGSHGFAVGVLNGSVYAAGTRGGFPALWKHASNLGVIWRQQDTSIANAQFQGMTAVGNAIYAVGQTYGAAGAEQYVVARYDESGNRIWSRSFGGANSDVLNGAVAVGDRLFVVGYTRSGGAGGSDGVLMEISTADGALLSTTYFGGAQDDALRGIATDGTDLYVVGESKSFASASGNAVGQNDLVLLRYTLGPASLTDITVTPSDPTINVGQSQAFTATGTFSDGSSRALTSGDGTWTTKASIPTARSAVVTGGNGMLYAVGGTNNVCGAFATLEVYDPSTNAWTGRASMPTARWGHAAGTLGGILYAVGGTNGCYTPTTGLTTVEAYDPATNSWTTKASMQTGRLAFGVGVVNGILYAVGGEGSSGGGMDATLEAYNPATNTWTTMAPMPTARYTHGVGVVNGILYAVGGIGANSALATLEAYDPGTNTWTTKAPMPTARTQLAVESVNGVLYAVGGNIGGSATYDTVEAYDPSTDHWTTMAPMPTARVALSAGVVNNILYAAGGGTAGNSQVATVEAFTPPEATWSSSDPSVAPIDVNGLTTGASAGITAITATASGIIGSTTLTVADTNRAPLADAGTDQAVEATGPAGAIIALDGSGSSDPDGDTLSYGWSGAFGAASGASPSVTLSLGTHTLTLTVSDGQSAASDTAVITVRDTIAPVLGLPASFAAEATGAAGTTIHYAVSVADAGDADPATACAPASGSTFALGTTTVNCLATDASGNGTSGSFAITVVDTTPPTLSVPAPITVFAIIPSDGVIDYAASATDTVDPDPSLFCAPAPGASYPLGTTTVMCFSTDASGNGANASFTITVIDSAAPVLTVPGDLTVTATSPAGAVVDYAASAADGFDADPDLSCSPASGSTFALGTTTVNCTATDDSGNGARASFTVHVGYAFSGFFQPVDNPPTLNVVKAGSAVPVKFSLNGDFGLGIFAAGFPRSQAVSCEVTTSVDGIEETVTAGGSSLSYGAALDQYRYVWKTDKSWAGTCRQLVVKLSDGTVHWASFMLK